MIPRRCISLLLILPFIPLFPHEKSFEAARRAREPSPPTRSKPRESFSGTVEKISDGDTIHVLANRVRRKIRFRAIDNPEKNQDYGPFSSDCWSSMVKDKTVTVLKYKKDQYGCDIADVYYGDT